VEWVQWAAIDSLETKNYQLAIDSENCIHKTACNRVSAKFGMKVPSELNLWISPQFVREQWNF
jgi:hypothetical protein